MQAGAGVGISREAGSRDGCLSGAIAGVWQADSTGDDGVLLCQLSFHTFR